MTDPGWALQQKMKRFQQVATQGQRVLPALDFTAMVA
jgi:hypothetical protein